MNFFVLCKVFFLLLFQTLFYVPFYHHAAAKPLSSQRDSTLVHFDPYVSILDKTNRFRYTPSDMVPMVTKIASKFSHVYIEMSVEDLQGELFNSSLSLSPLAVALYNLQLNKSRTNNEPFLDVWLSYAFSSEPATQLTNRLVSIANQANEIFNGTVTTILLPFSLFQIPEGGKTVKRFNYGPIFTFLENYKRGFVLQTGACNQNPNSINSASYEIRSMKPDIVIVSTFMNPTKNKITLAHNNIQTYLTNTMTQCRQKFNSTNIPRMGFLVTNSDTAEDGKVNLSQFISMWNEINQWSRDNDVPVIISKAFDTPYEATTQKKTSGLWRIQEDLKHQARGGDGQVNHTFNFEGKQEIADQVDKEENDVNPTWLEQDVNFKREYFGAIFSLQRESPLTATQLNTLIQELPAKFSKLVIVMTERVERYYDDLINLSGSRDLVEIVVLRMPNVSTKAYTDETKSQFGVDKNLIKNKVKPFEGINGPTKYSNFGYAFPISICGSYWLMPEEEEEQGKKYYVKRTISFARAVYFYYEEDTETVKLGARRMFQQRIILFEQCREFVEKLKSRNIEMVFVMMSYHHTEKNEAEFYNSPRSIQNYVLYWEMMNNWATEMKTTVIMSNVLEGFRDIGLNGDQREELGWWRCAKENSIIDKKEDARRTVSKRSDLLTPQPPSSSLTVNQMVLISVLPLLVSIMVIALSLYLVRKYYRKHTKLLSKLEMDVFFNGSSVPPKPEDNNIAHKYAYDMSLYEVSLENFTIDEKATLGSGEFGMVCRGTIKKEKTDIVNVAVKTVALENLHKFALNGLLSEIKVLSYVKSHQNIVQLLGANTSDLKNGKIFVFLELCEMGCLEKHLRLLRLIKLERSAPLASSTSADLYRWSKEIATGMSFLATKKVVHADLATRNVLLNANKTAKICDFGLARRMYNYANYVKQQQEPLPWRWMPPESLQLLKFNEKSDVWAYGVTLWEVYTLGDVPYPGLFWDFEFPEMLERGLRLNEPKYNDHHNMYSVMMECWKIHPDQRPSFADLVAKLS